MFIDVAEIYVEYKKNEYKPNQNQTHRYREQSSGYQRGREALGEGGMCEGAQEYVTYGTRRFRC